MDAVISPRPGEALIFKLEAPLDGLTQGEVTFPTGGEDGDSHRLAARKKEARRTKLQTKTDKEKKNSKTDEF